MLKTDDLKIGETYTVMFLDGNRTRGEFFGHTKVAPPLYAQQLANRAGKRAERLPAIQLRVDDAPMNIAEQDIDELYEGDCTDCSKEDKSNVSNAPKSGKPVRSVRKASDKNDS